MIKIPYPWTFVKNGKAWSHAEAKGCMSLHMKEKSLGLSRNLMQTPSTVLPQMSYYFFVYYNLVTPIAVIERSYFALLHASRYLRVSEVYPDTVQYDCDRVFCVPRMYCPWKEQALPILPFANSQALVIHRDPVSRGGLKKKTKT